MKRIIAALALLLGITTQVFAASTSYQATLGSGAAFAAWCVGGTGAACTGGAFWPSTVIANSAGTELFTSTNAGLIDCSASNNTLCGILSAPPTPGSASGGLSVKTLVGLTNTAGGTAVKASAGQVYKGQCYNPDPTNSAVLEFFNTASVTLGTTAVYDFVEIGPASNAGFALSLVGAQYSTAITVAAVKTIGSSTAPTTAIDCTVYYN